MDLVELANELHDNLADAGNKVSPVFHAPAWSEFSIVTPDGTRGTVTVELPK
jgi:hypothetical protein